MRSTTARLKALFASIFLTAAIVAATPMGASSASCVAWTGTQPVDFAGSHNVLQGAATTSPCNAWAVGYYFDGTYTQALVEHWDGSSWTVQIPEPIGFSGTKLNDVDATSASNAWAVG